MATSTRRPVLRRDQLVDRGVDAAYSPPMPAPVRKRAPKYHMTFIENAVRTVATV